MSLGPDNLSLPECLVLMFALSFQTVGVLWGMPCNFFLITIYDGPVKRNCYKCVFSSGLGEEEAYCMINMIICSKINLLMSLCLWTVNFTSVSHFFFLPNQDV